MGIHTIYLDEKTIWQQLNVFRHGDMVRVLRIRPGIRMGKKIDLTGSKCRTVGDRRASLSISEGGHTGSR